MRACDNLQAHCDARFVLELLGHAAVPAVTASVMPGAHLACRDFILTVAAAEEEDKRRAEQEAAAATRRSSRRSSVTPGRPGSRRPSAAVAGKHAFLCCWMAYLLGVGMHARRCSKCRLRTHTQTGVPAHSSLRCLLFFHPPSTHRCRGTAACRLPASWPAGAAVQPRQLFGQPEQGGAARHRWAGGMWRRLLDSRRQCWV